MRLFHKGVVLRGEKLGSAIRTTRQWQVRQGQVLLSRIDARNGAIGIVPLELDGAIVTNDFWAFAVNLQSAVPAFLDAYFGTAEFVDACKAASEGTTNRVRLQPEGFLKSEVPLPSLDEQRRIVSRIEELAEKIRTDPNTPRRGSNRASPPLAEGCRATSQKLNTGGSQTATRSRVAKRRRHPEQIESNVLEWFHPLDFTKGHEGARTLQFPGSYL